MIVPCNLSHCTNPKITRAHILFIYHNCDHIIKETSKFNKILFIIKKKTHCTKTRIGLYICFFERKRLNETFIQILPHNTKCAE